MSRTLYLSWCSFIIIIGEICMSSCGTQGYFTNPFMYLVVITDTCSTLRSLADESMGFPSMFLNPYSIFTAWINAAGFFFNLHVSFTMGGNWRRVTAMMMKMIRGQMMRVRDHTCNTEILQYNTYTNIIYI